MSVRKRTWTTRKGVAKFAFVLDYVDQHGKRHIETYKTEREAKKRAIDVGAAVNQGRQARRAGPRSQVQRPALPAALLRLMAH
jgi:hypothetical protein